MLSCYYIVQNLHFFIFFDVVRGVSGAVQTIKNRRFSDIRLVPICLCVRQIADYFNSGLKS